MNVQRSQSGSISKLLVTDGASKSALASVRSLAQRGLQVHVAADTRLALAKWSRFATKRYLVPSPQNDPAQFAASLAKLQRIEHFDAVIPVSDFDIAALLDHENLWQDSGMKVALPRKSAFATARDKSSMMKCAIRAGVPCPETWFPDEMSIEQICEDAKFPLLIKPNISAGARGITMVENRESLLSSYQSIVEKWGPSHLQEWIPDGGDQLKADIVVGRDGQPLALFVCRKIRYFPVNGGSSTLIVSQKHAEIEHAVLQVIKELGWFGFADFDFIVDPRDGVAKLMECNPRFPESLVVNLFAGVDFPWLMYQLASTGNAEPVNQYQEGRYARFLVGDLMWFLNSQDRWRAEPSFFRFFGKNLTYYIERLDDPGPTMCYLIESLRTLCSPRQMAYRFGRGFQRKNDTRRARPTG